MTGCFYGLLVYCCLMMSTSTCPFYGQLTGRDCYETSLKSPSVVSGVYTITVSEDKPLKVYCDMKTDGGGWTVIQRRRDGSEDFYREWIDYKTGFGNIREEFWLGLDNIHSLTNQDKEYSLRIDMEDFDNNHASAQYNHFSVGNEQNGYKLNVRDYSGTAGDSLSYHNDMEFATKDRDNNNCAVTSYGAWWYNHCHWSNLNGKYAGGHNSRDDANDSWNTWRGADYGLKMIEMKIRPSMK
ncbi:fibrinogen C domain-containing protein 1-B-like [Saccoglossus kowalevskii]|uniref:Tenascin-R-like n=1 Tax=Saccoglossus kowalevskii TaxID=10224 RepID=A0ABM0GJS3_SACKO|nr:PREDICTED: tenascin-R-like [Saccoglossus kowalevskii]